MLKVTSLSFLLFAIFSCVLSEEKVETYPDKYDYVDVDEILANTRLKDQYYDCFMDLGPCVTPDQKFFREFIPEAFLTQCKKCTEKQKIMFDKVADHYSSNYPAKWDAVIQKYIIDPTRLKQEKGSK